MAFSNLVMFAIIAATAATLSSNGQHDVTSADQAAAALEPIAGRFSSVLFALGFIGSGMLAVPILAGAGSAGLAGLLGKPTGFSNKPKEAPAFYGLVALGTMGGIALSLAGFDPITLLIFAAIINGIAAAPFLLVTLLIAGNQAIMGNSTNGRLSNIFGWTTFAIMTAAAALIATQAAGG
jgi:Mn2+/Fe2+ NRAMP family transporter